MKRLKLFATSAVAITATFIISPPAQAQSDPLLGQMMLFGGTFCPRGWGEAKGTLLPISQYSALFSLLGTMYGGDGRTTFGLPDLRGRAPISLGQGPGLPAYPQQGARGGSTQFSLTIATMPSHNHVGMMRASNLPGDTANPNDNSLATTGSATIYHTGAPAVNMDTGTVVISNTGGSVPVNKVSPYLVMRWCVAMQGVFPSRN
ncbi:tail fiber protein [Sphingorhabdus sp. YGSMI21]|uniref:phage tail protein n=1 Tax=Sphingorhabdus sp. YGSMI21 TaxID=2077182 RepID=UPI0019801372|nr:tail fiber protein [Sphingorhabdus sp. YGSMI21]